MRNVAQSKLLMWRGYGIYSGTRLLREENAMSMPGKLPHEQPDPQEAPPMNRHPYRPAPVPAGGGAPVVPLYRRAPRALDEAHAALREVAPERCIQRAYYLEARKAFSSDTALADAMGVHRSQVTRWAQGSSAQAGNAWLLRDLAAAVSRLADFYQSATIHRWLFGDNPDLDGRQPMELLRQGRLPEVLMAIQAQTSGAFG
jgi:hypothetical protein